MATPPENTGFSYPLHAMAMIEKWSARIANRPHERAKDGGIILNAAQCEWECAKCYMECAIAPGRLEWWEQELARSCGSSAMGRA